MFVHDDDAGWQAAVQVKLFAAGGHGQRQGRGFAHGHAAKEDGHGPRCGLIVRNVARSVAAHKRANLLGAQFPAIAFFDDDLNRVHGHASG